MKKRLKKLALNRESLRRLDEAELRSPAGGAATNPCPFTLQVLACYSADIHTCQTCVCTV
jgi:hypothetical protein